MRRGALLGAVVGIALLAACDGSSVLVGVADPPPAARAPGSQPVPAGPPPGTDPAGIACPARPDVPEKLATFEAVSDLKGFAANDAHAVYVTSDWDKGKALLWHVTGGGAPVLIDEANGGYPGAMVVEDDRAYWASWASQGGTGVNASLRRASFAGGTASRLLEAKEILDVRRLAPSELLVLSQGAVQRIPEDGPPQRLLWANPPGEVRASWALTARHAYWVNGQALYRADRGALAQEAVHEGPVFGAITADSRRVYWMEDSATTSRLLAFDGDDLDRGVFAVAALPRRVHALALHAIRSAIYVLVGSSAGGKSEVWRVDLTSGVTTTVFRDAGYNDAIFTPCTLVYSDGFNLLRRPLPP